MAKDENLIISSLVIWTFTIFGLYFHIYVYPDLLIGVWGLMFFHLIIYSQLLFNDNFLDCIWNMHLFVLIHLFEYLARLYTFFYVTTYTLDYSPAQYLLHHTHLTRPEYFKSLAMHMVNAARLCIPVHWRSTHTPTIGEWFSRISKIEEMEELIYISQERITKFTNTWACSCMNVQLSFRA